MVSLFRNRNFSLLWFAGLISLTGNWMIIAAMPFHVYAVTGSALATSGWLVAYILPGALFGSIAGVFVDRWDRRRIMIAVNMMQAIIVLLLFLVQTPEWIWLVYVVGFIEATLAQFAAPAESSLLPQLVDEQQLVAANSLNALNDNLGRILGPAIGGIALGTWGLSSVVVADAISFLAAAALTAWVSVPASNSSALPKQNKPLSLRAQFAGVRREWVDGLRFVSANPQLSAIFRVMAVALFADAIISAVLVVFIQDDVGLGAQEFGWILTARGIGGFVGGLLLAQFGRKIPSGILASIGLALSGVALLVMLAYPSALVLIIGTGLVGMPAIAWMVAIQTMLQTATDDQFMGRVFGAYGTTAASVMLVSSLLAGTFTDITGAAPLVFIGASLYLAAGLIAYPMLHRRHGVELQQARTAADANATVIQ